MSYVSKVVVPWVFKILKKGEGVFHKSISVEIKLGWLLCILGGCVLIGVVVGQL